MESSGTSRSYSPGRSGSKLGRGSRAASRSRWSSGARTPLSYPRSA
jgi:hypothetical protein